MTRRESREAAMCLLYEYSFNTHKTPGKSSAARRRTGGKALRLCARAVHGRLRAPAEIDAILAASAENWRLHRIARVPLAVLRLAVYELLTAGAENERIIINEALEICRTYADEKAVAFVNGVLGKAADAVGSTRA
ncbi:MAG: transcription antitermination factor NusB [Acutalibacteraceae bacterium]